MTVPKCILKTGCVHNEAIGPNKGCCQSINRCGAGYALCEASMPGGYRVIVRDNLTINALVQAGLVDLSTPVNGVATATARIIS